MFIFRWTVTELCAHNPQHMEYEYLRLRREKHYTPVPVDIDCRVVTELEVSTKGLLLPLNYV